MADDDDKVGYGRPPKASRFKPGKSGNPKGRPKASLSLRSVLERLFKKTVELRNGKKIPLLEAILTAQAAKATKGDTKATHFLTTLFTLIDDAKQQDEIQLTKEEHAILARSLERFEGKGGPQ